MYENSSLSSQYEWSGRGILRKKESIMLFKKVGLIVFSYVFCATITNAPSYCLAGDNPADKLTVYVVNYPLKYFAERIGGEYVTVVFPAPADEDPAFWVPDVNTISAYQKADLILLNGATYAKWVEKVTLPRSRLVNTSRSFKGQYIRIEGAVTHSHGSEGEHAHEGVAFTTWLDFDFAAKQAKAIAKALTRKNPDLRETLQKNYKALERDLVLIDKNIKTIVSKNPSKQLIGSHPVYDYFTRRYGLNMKSVHWEPDEIPSNEQWAELQAILKSFPAKWMIWEGNPIKEPVAKLKSIGINSLVFDPCGNVPDQGDFLSVMWKNVENLKPAFR
jgi:zinc transport system substrate-binding protein